MPAMEFSDALTRQIIRSWRSREPHRDPVFTRLGKPLRECKVALLSTAGLARTDDRPFDQEGERKDPWWGDPSYRVIPRGTRTEEVSSYHLHINTGPLGQDLNCVLPLDRLEELCRDGEVGAVAESHYSMMGYLLDTTSFERDTVPEIAERMRAEAVDAALLVPV